MQLSDEQRLIRDEVARFLDASGGLGPARAAADGAGAGDLWARFAGDLGMAAALVPEVQGGLGLGMVEACLIAQELGQRLAPLPFGVVAEAALVLRQVAQGPLRDDLLGRIARGAVIAVVADGDRLALRGDSLDGTLVAAAAAEGFLLCRADGLWWIDGAETRVIPLAMLDATRPAVRLHLDATPARSLGDVPDLAPARARARLIDAAEALGAARGAFDLTREYIAGRVQFGRSIASFQAVKHRVAALYARLVSAGAMLSGLAAAIDAGMDAPLAEAESDAALAQAVEVLDLAAAEAIQLHGGVGFTWEYPPHLFFKRAQAVRQKAGQPQPLFTGLGRRVAAGALPVIQPPGKASAFRAEVADWLAMHLTGRFAPLVGRGGAGDGEALPELRKDWERELAAGGWIGLGLPRDLGGRGLNVAEQVIFNEEYARAGGPGRMGHIGEGLVAPTLAAFGTKGQQARHLPGILSGSTFWAQGYSEPGAGSDLAAVRTRARQDPSGDWRVTGQKIWTSLAHLSDWIFVLARGEEGSVGRKGLVFLLLPLDQPGIEIRPIRQMNGGAEFNEVFFDGARAASDDLVGGVGQGWQVAMALLGFERGISTLGQQLGFARELAALARRLPSGRPDLDAALGRAWAGLRAMRYGALETLDALERGASGPEGLTWKYEWSNWHRALGELALDILGADGLALADDPDVAALQQMAMFSRAETIYGGTNEVQLNIIAEQGLGMPREPRGGA